MQSIYFVRHGKTAANLEGRLSGQTNSNLIQSKEDIEDKLKKTLKPKPGYKVYSSPSIRAQKTAECFDINYEILEDFKELHFGLFEDLTFNEIKETYPEEFNKMINENVYYRFPQGESFAMVIARASNALAKIMEEEKEKDIVVFTHGGVIQSLLSYYLCGNESMYWNFRIGNTSVTQIYFCDGLAVVEKLNL